MSREGGGAASRDLEPTGAEYLIGVLERQGVEVVFGYPGGAIMPVYDALVDSSIRHVLVRHEQGAAFAADGYARATGRVGVCMATSGPGATNLLTGLANAHMDSIPIVAITGQVPVDLIGTDAFQEVDVLGMSLPVVKHSFLPTEPDELVEVLADAFRLASTGRPGPVLVDLPKDVGAGALDTVGSVPDECDPTGQLRDRRGTGPGEGAPPPSDEAIEGARELLRDAHRPLVYAGGGIVLGGLVEEFRAFVETTEAPVVSTLKGLGSIPTDHPAFLGMMGMHGTRAANLALESCDLLICIGARFDDRATGDLEGFAPGAAVIHMDVDPGEVGKLRRVEAPIVGDVTPALVRLAEPLEIEDWRRHCAALQEEHAWDYDPPIDGIYAPRMLRDLSRAAGEKTIVTCDVGQHQMWVAQHWTISRPERHLSSGGLGAMGYGLPAAIGASLGRPSARVINVSGDGSFLMNVQELATVVRYDLPIKVLILDNSALGMVRQWQELFFERRYSEIDLADNPDFVRVAEAFGVSGFRLDDPADVADSIERFLGCDGPAVLQVSIDPEANVWPLVPPGASNSEMMHGGEP